MADIKLAPGFWRTRGGQKAEVVWQAADGAWVGVVRASSGMYANSWNERGYTCMKNHDHAWDIIAPWREPIRGEAWAVIGDDGEIKTFRLEKGHGPEWEKGVRIRYEEVTDGP